MAEDNNKPILFTNMRSFRKMEPLDFIEKMIMMTGTKGENKMFGETVPWKITESGKSRMKPDNKVDLWGQAVRLALCHEMFMQTANNKSPEKFAINEMAIIGISDYSPEQLKNVLVGIGRLHEDGLFTYVGKDTFGEQIFTITTIEEFVSSMSEDLTIVRMSEEFHHCTFFFMKKEWSVPTASLFLNGCQAYDSADLKYRLDIGDGVEELFRVAENKKESPIDWGDDDMNDDGEQWA